jgi:hypothetical protein
MRFANLKQYNSLLINNASRTSITIQLRGGIGNQLFQYCAGVYLALSNSFNLIVDDSGVDHGETLRNFNLPGQFKSNEDLLWKINNRIFRSQTVIDHSGNIGFADLDLRLPQGSRVKGFFQNFKYVESLKAQGFTFAIEPTSLSLEILNLYKKMKFSQATLIHIRKGDYDKAKDTLGNLSREYYLSALGKIPRSQRGKVFILSDDPLAASESLIGKDVADFEFIPVFEGVPNSEYLFLFEAASNIIIANSSYSWWGSYLSNGDRRIMAPTPWFKKNTLNMQVDGCLQLPQWVSLESIWS